MYTCYGGVSAGSRTSCPVLQAVALGCDRNQRLLFANLSFRLQAGDMLRIHGPNGSGKSSLLRLLCGLASPAAGHVEWFGKTWERGGLAVSRLLWIGHATALKAQLTAEENLARLAAMHVRDAGAEIVPALAAAGLHGFEETPCHALSAGQQRRIALARLYLPDAPELWLLDEPFTSLDAAGTVQLETRLARHCDGGGTVVLTTHHALTRRGSSYADLDLARYVK